MNLDRVSLPTCGSTKKNQTGHWAGLDGVSVSCDGLLTRPCLLTAGIGTHNPHPPPSRPSLVGSNGEPEVDGCLPTLLGKLVADKRKQSGVYQKAVLRC